MPQMPRISLIAAMTQDRVIGQENTLPWRLSRDLKRFKALTLNKPVIMGRKTYLSIGRPLPERVNIILSRDKHFHAEGCLCAANIHDAISLASGNRGNATEIMVIGGAQIYRQFLSQARRLYLTEVDANIDGDAYFPTLPEQQWAETESERHPADADNEYPVRFVTLDRKASDDD